MTALGLRIWPGRAFLALPCSCIPIRKRPPQWRYTEFEDDGQPEMTATAPDQLDRIKAVFEKIDRKLEAIAADQMEIKITLAKTAERFNSIDQRFDAIDQHFEDTGKRFEARFDAVDQRFDAMEKRQDNFEERSKSQDNRL